MTTKLLANQLQSILADPVEGFTVELADESSLYEWKVYIEGPKETCYEGGVFQLSLSFPKDYPMNPPTLRFISDFWHPNVYVDGKVCMSILHPPGDDVMSGELARERWLPTQSVTTIVLSLMSLLNDPNCSSPANVDASVEWRQNRPAYIQKCKKLVERANREKPPHVIIPHPDTNEAEHRRVVQKWKEMNAGMDYDEFYDNEEDNEESENEESESDENEDEDDLVESNGGEINSNDEGEREKEEVEKKKDGAEKAEITVTSTSSDHVASSSVSPPSSSSISPASPSPSDSTPPPAHLPTSSSSSSIASSLAVHPPSASPSHPPSPSPSHPPSPAPSHPSSSSSSSSPSSSIVEIVPAPNKNKEERKEIVAEPSSSSGPSNPNANGPNPNASGPNPNPSGPSSNANSPSETIAQPESGRGKKAKKGKKKKCIIM